MKSASVGRSSCERPRRTWKNVRRVVTYINDEVVPDIRRNGSQALRAAAEALQKLAQHMDDRKAASGGGAAPGGPATDGKDAPKP
jgi:hypothetical protein